MLNDENGSIPELPLFDGVGLSNIVVTCDEVELMKFNLFLKLFPLVKLRAQMESTILYSEYWLMSSHLLYVLYSINP